MLLGEKIYEVTFINYTNYSKSCVYDAKALEYQDVDDGALLIPESKLEDYRRFGGGYKTTLCVGYLPQAVTEVNQPT